MAFEWLKYYKWDENFEREATEAVEDYVIEFYGVEDLFELTEENIKEIQDFHDEMSDYSCMKWGFANLLSTLEDQ